MYLAAVEQRLKAANIFKQVGSVTSFAALKKKPISKSTAAFVIPITEKLGRQELLGGMLEQHSTDTFAIIIAVKDRRDASGSVGSSIIDELRTPLRQLLFGWSPGAEYEPILLGDGRLLALDDHTVFWQDKFTTAHSVTGNYQ